MTSKRYRILYVEKATDTVGGSVIGLYELIAGLDRSRFEPVVLLYGPSAYSERFEKLGVQVIMLGDGSPTAVAESRRDIAASLSRFGNWLGDFYRIAKRAYLVARRDWPFARRIARLIKDESIDLVHHNNSLPENLATIMAARIAGVPQISHVRVLHTFSSIERIISGLVNEFIYMSTAIEKLYRARGIPVDKGTVIYDAFDLAAFDPSNHNGELRSEFGLRDGDNLVSNVGRLDWWKGQDDFLQAMSDVIRTYPNTKALIVGAPERAAINQTYYRKLQQLVTDLQLTDHVIFTGFRSDIPRIMAGSDVIVHSASEPEPFGRVIVEAMAAGTPVVATAAGGVLDILEDGVTGLLVPPKNAASMAIAIQQLLQDKRRAKSIAQRARKYAEKNFSIEQHVTEVQHIYQGILHSS